MKFFLYIYSRLFVFQSFQIMLTLLNFPSSGSHVTVESLLKDADLKKTIRDLVRGSGRSYPHEDEEPTEALNQTSQVARSNGVGQREPLEWCSYWT